jgi:hypothetical protein
MPKENIQKSCVITFPSTHYALKAEKAFKKHSIEVKLIPVPRHISSDCGIALEFDCPDKEQISQIIRKSALIIEGIHIL